MAEITQFLNKQGRQGRPVNEQLFRLAYEELRLLAQARLRIQREHATFSPTGLVHQAFLRMVDLTKVTWEGKQHFMIIASHAMRRILSNHARSHHAQKRGNGIPTVSLEAALRIPTDAPSDLMLALNEAVDRLHKFDPMKAQIVEMRYFAGFTEAEVADLLGLSRPTVQRHWYTARAWLYKELSPLMNLG